MVYDDLRKKWEEQYPQPDTQRSPAPTWRNIDIGAANTNKINRGDPGYVYPDGSKTLWSMPIDKFDVVNKNQNNIPRGEPGYVYPDGSKVVLSMPIKDIGYAPEINKQQAAMQSAGPPPDDWAVDPTSPASLRSAVRAVRPVQDYWASNPANEPVRPEAWKQREMEKDIGSAGARGSFLQRPESLDMTQTMNAARRTAQDTAKPPRKAPDKSPLAQAPKAPDTAKPGKDDQDTIRLDLNNPTVEALTKIWRVDNPDPSVQPTFEDLQNTLDEYIMLADEKERNNAKTAGAVNPPQKNPTNARFDPKNPTVEDLTNLWRLVNADNPNVDTSKAPTKEQLLNTWFMANAKPRGDSDKGNTRLDPPDWLTDGGKAGFDSNPTKESYARTATNPGNDFRGRAGYGNVNAAARAVARGDDYYKPHGSKKLEILVNNGNSLDYIYTPGPDGYFPSPAELDSLTYRGLRQAYALGLDDERIPRSRLEAVRRAMDARPDWEKRAAYIQETLGEDVAKNVLANYYAKQGPSDPDSAITQAEIDERKSNSVAEINRGAAIDTANISAGASIYASDTSERIAKNNLLAAQIKAISDKEDEKPVKAEQNEDGGYTLLFKDGSIKTNNMYPIMNSLAGNDIPTAARLFNNQSPEFKEMMVKILPEAMQGPLLAAAKRNLNGK